MRVRVRACVRARMCVRACVRAFECVSVRVVLLVGETTDHYFPVRHVTIKGGLSVLHCMSERSTLGRGRGWESGGGQNKAVTSLWLRPNGVPTSGG